MEKIFSLAYLSIKVILTILFLCSSNVEINFLNLKHIKRTGIFIKVILTTRQIKLAEKKEFVIISFNLKKNVYYSHR